MKKPSQKILIIGGTAAGPAAAAKAKRVNPSAEVTLFEKGEFISYGTCSMPYYIGNVIQDYQSLISFSPEQFQKEKGCVVKIGHQVEEILPHRRRITVRDLAADKSEEFNYDKLIITTGARARVPDPSWLQFENVFVVKDLSGSIRLKSFIEANRPSKAVIIGGGFIGMEMAEALFKQNIRVTVLHKDTMPMNGLEPESQKIVLDELKRNGVGFTGMAKVQGFKTSGKKVTAVQTDLYEFDADLVVLALGFEPQSDLAKAAKIRTGRWGGILTDTHLKSSADNVFAAGACCEVRQVVHNRWIYLPLANIANKMGWIAGENAAGGFAEFAGVVRTTAVKIFSLEVASVGLSSAEAEREGMKIQTETISAHSRVKSYPGSQQLLIKFIIDSHSKRLLGANLIGEEGAALRADVLSMAIRSKMTVREIADQDFMYTPPFSPVWDPILVAANKSLKGM